MTTTTKLLDEFAALLDTMDDGGAALPAAVPESAPVTPTPAGASPQPKAGEVVLLADVRAQAEARKAAREAMADGAMHAAVEALQIIRKTFAEKGADFDDACKALPLVHKVLEHVDRMEAAAKDAKNLPMLSFQIVLDPSVQQVPPPNKRARTLTHVAGDVIDMDDLDA